MSILRALVLPLSLPLALVVGCIDASTIGKASTDGNSSASTDSTDSTGSTDTTAATEEPGDGTEDPTTGVDLGDFERFLISTGAGPCGPEEDCDGFVELLAGGTLRVERFGDVSDEVIESQITAEDYDAAVLVFLDPALLDLLDAPGPLCEPPTDVGETMRVEEGGASHEASTTTCPQPPIAAAREVAVALRDKYAP